MDLWVRVVYVVVAALLLLVAYVVWLAWRRETCEHQEGYTTIDSGEEPVWCESDSALVGTAKNFWEGHDDGWYRHRMGRCNRCGRITALGLEKQDPRGHWLEVYLGAVWQGDILEELNKQA